MPISDHRHNFFDPTLTLMMDSYNTWPEDRLWNWLQLSRHNLIIRTHYECEDGIEKSIWRITDSHRGACRVMANGEYKRPIFYPILTRIIDSFSCTRQNTLYCIGKREKRFQKILNTLRCDIHSLVTCWRHFNITMTPQIDVRPACSRRAAYRSFILTAGWYGYVRWKKKSYGQ